MTKSITLYQNRNGVYTTQRPEPRRTNAGSHCPSSLADAFRNHQISYEGNLRFFYSPAPLHRIEWWRDTQEWVGVYRSELMDNYGGRWSEQYVWAVRNGRLSEIRQFNVRGVGWRKAVHGWHNG